jgi:diaminopimelate epimerase
MPEVTFHKYQGTGNDFVMIDDRKETFDLKRKDLIAKWCDRRFGIGADGVILIRNHHTCDFEMIYFNPDGSQSLCGNGSRCAIRFAHDLGIIGHRCLFEAVDGEHQGNIDGNIISVKMQDVGKPSELDGEYFIDTGSPHHIKIVKELAIVDVRTEGKSIRDSQVYQPGGTNVNFVEPSNGTVMIRTFERGVEDETLSCGTGVTAAALVMASLGYSSPVKVKARGGELMVSFDRRNDQSFQEIYLRGPAEKVYQGAINY